ncbi:MAG: bifunctional phosphoribosylaminoimidazolecarboxamide formyltransferase/IMP cyclohydrolase [Aquihabitans sp.]
MRALISVYDKTGIEDLAKGLTALGWSLTSSGGTARLLRDAGLKVDDTAEVTGFPAILGHRVVTLHPKIHGGILADRSNPHHVAELEQYGIDAIDLVVGNLYPFGEDPSAFAHGGGAAEDLIDIGGPAMVRAAAKNHANVGVVVRPDDYADVLAEIQANGSLSADTRRSLARAAFAHTASYDASVVNWFDSDGPDEILPPTLHVTATREDRTLRYGENPHQKAALYREQGADPWWATAVQHGGVAMSYLNLYDADAAWLLAHDLGTAGGTQPAQPTVTIIKHANPCGAAVAPTLAEAYQKAFDCDPRSAFGGIVALNQVVDDATVVEMVAAAQADLVIAPGYAPGVVEQLQAKRKNTRLIEAVAPQRAHRHLRPITGGWLVQEPHRLVATPDQWHVVTERQPTAAELVDAALAFRICAATTSNAIVLVKDGVAWGIGAGQQNRVEAGQIAATKADGRAVGGACASDAFYPFPDGIEAAAAAGVSVIVQPGGSIRDEKNTARANELGVAMVFTGERQFKH